MTLASDAPRGEVGCSKRERLHVPAKNVLWYSGEIVGMNASTGIAEPLAVGTYPIGVTPENTKRDLTGVSSGAERVEAMSGGFSFPQDGSIAVDSAPGKSIYWVIADNKATASSNNGANPFLGPLIRGKSLTDVHVDIQLEHSIGGPGFPKMQAVNATLVAGTATVSTGISVAAASEVIVSPKGDITGSTNFAMTHEKVASRVVGNPGTGSVIVEALSSSGTIDSDAAGDVRVVILTP